MLNQCIVDITLFRGTNATHIHQLIDHQVENFVLSIPSILLIFFLDLKYINYIYRILLGVTLIHISN